MRYLTKNVRLWDSQPFEIDRPKSEHLTVGRLWEVDAYEDRTKEGLLLEAEVRGLIYFTEDNLLHAISKLRYAYSCY